MMNSASTLWICSIVPLLVIAIVKVSLALAGQHTVDWVALAIRLFMFCSIVLVVETLIEMRLRAWRSSD